MDDCFIILIFIVFHNKSARFFHEAGASFLPGQSVIAVLFYFRSVFRICSVFLKYFPLIAWSCLFVGESDVMPDA